MGSPEDSDLGFLRSDNARKYIKKLNHCPKQQLIKKFPNMLPLAADLAERMLVFDPCRRITGKHLYQYHESMISVAAISADLIVIRHIVSSQSRMH